MTARARSSKTVTRRAVRAARARRTPAQARAVEAALAEEVTAAVVASLRRPGASGAPAPVAAYASLPGEPGTRRLREVLRGLGHRVLLPVLLADLELDWVADPGRHLGGDPLRPPGTRLGPGAPGSCGLVLVPALAVDARGTRLGQGGGSYDRVLARLPAGPPGAARPLVLAVVHEDEVLAGPLPREPHDVAVDGALTPAGLVLLGPG